MSIENVQQPNSITSAGSEKLPVIHNGRYKCMLCGRDKFTSKTPHKCIGGYRKRKIIWQEV
jgi:hypothetical protein